MKKSGTIRTLCSNCSCGEKENYFRPPIIYRLIMLVVVIRSSSAWMARSLPIRAWGSSALNLATDSRRLRFEGQSSVTDFFSDLAVHIKSKSYSNYAVAVPASAVVTEEIVMTAGVGSDDKRPSKRNEGISRYHRRFYSSSSPDRASKSFKSASKPPMEWHGPSLQLTEDEISLFRLLGDVRKAMGLSTTLRVAGGWVRDKLLATNEFQTYHKIFEVGSGSQRLTSKFRRHASAAEKRGFKNLGFTGNSGKPVDIDIALDDMLGREFADYLNEYLSSKGEDTVTIGVVMKNPEKSKHLETATMKVGSFWIDFVNLRAEEYTQDSRIPDLMRIGTPAEDAFRRDLTINALFYNVNTGKVEDWTGRGLEDLQKGIVATPLPPLTTLLDDPLRVLRAIRFAARLRFLMDKELVEAAKDDRVRQTLAQKVSRERIGAELDLMLRSPDPMGAMRLLINLKLVDTVLPVHQYIHVDGVDAASLFQRGLKLLSTAHDYLSACRWSPPLWCQNTKQTYGEDELTLKDDEEKRRLLWYASFFKPQHDVTRRQPNRKTSRAGRKSSRSPLIKLLVDDMKRPVREAQTIEHLIETADEITQIVESGHYVSSIMILLSDVQVARRDLNGESNGTLLCSMNGRVVDSTNEADPVWQHAMEFRQLCAPLIKKIGQYWRAALLLAISEQLATVESDDLEYTIEGDTINEVQEERRQGIIEKYDAFATALQEVGLIGIQNEKPLISGDALKRILTKIPRGPAFREVMDEQMEWMTAHPGSHAEALEDHLKLRFPDYL